MSQASKDSPAGPPAAETGRRQVAVIERQGLEQLFTLLKADGYQLLGPRVREGAIAYAELSALGDLPAGWTDEQEKGSYRLQPRGDDSLFEFNTGPHSWKKFLFPSAQWLYRLKRATDGFEMVPTNPAAPQYAFIGVRPCDLAAIAIQDRVFLGGAYRDAGYQARRASTFIVAVNCGRAGGTCFCASLGTGPRATGGFDLVLTELRVEGAHDFVCETGSARGAQMLARLPHRPAAQTETQAVEQLLAKTTRQMSRTLPAEGLSTLLARNFEHAHWEQVAGRCLSCANCTLVCPTCFCSTVEDLTDLTGQQTDCWRKWDSCFTVDFTHVAGGSVRTSVKSRYRQWLTHKLGTWREQFGVPGCTGCGRCITWCPAGIDLTEEIRALQQGVETPTQATR